MPETYVVASSSQGNRLYFDPTLNGLILPQNHLEFHTRSVTHIISIRGVVGAPTSWSLDARFLKMVEHSSGPQYSNPEMVPFSLEETQNFVHGGVGLGKPTQQATIPNPAYSPAQLIANPAYSPFAETPEGDRNPAYDPRGVIANPALDVRERIANPAVPRSAGDYGRIVDHTDNPSGGNIIRLSWTVDNFVLRHKLQLRPTWEGGTNPNLVWTYLIQEND